MNEAAEPLLSDPARDVARATLYEGYVLWPYRKSAPKNQRRWTFGGVHPRAWSEERHPDDAWRMRVECLLRLPDGAEHSGEAPVLHVEARFLQVVERRVARVIDGRLEFAEQIDIDGERWVAWDEARERAIRLPGFVPAPGAEARAPITVPAGSERTWLPAADGDRNGAVVRSWRELAGEVRVRCEAASEGAVRVSVVVSNTSEWSGPSREDALRSTFASTHIVLRVEGGEFVSLTDPPDDLAQAAEACRNEGCWPVLVGDRRARDMVLASPIILPDYPVIAPESPGDLFDGGEIDEMLALHILALTDEEKEEMRATDPRTREILERTERLDRERLLGLHGAFRDGKTGDPIDEGGGPDAAAGMAEGAPDPFWVEMGRAPTSQVVHRGVVLRRGSRVRLHPSPGGDVMDIALAGRTAVVEGIDEDDQGGIQFTVVIEGDPGLDLGMARMPGHRFFFRPEEIEPLDDEVDGPAAADESARSPRVLVAGIGNVFLGDDGFGVEVARRLADREHPGRVTVEDYGIRGLDLAYALTNYDVAIFVDIVPRGGDPGTIYLIDASDEKPDSAGLQTHGMDPVSVLAFAREVGALPAKIYVVGCEPAEVVDPDSGRIVGELSEPVAAAVGEAAGRVEALLAELADARRATRTPETHSSGTEV